VLDFEAPDFAGSKLSSGFYTTLLVKSLGRHEAAHRAIGGDLLFAEQCPQIVIVQFDRPTGMIAVLLMKRLEQLRRERPRAAGVGPDSRLKRPNRIKLGPRCVKPFMRCNA
jgi:hypothetical protein